MPIVVVAEKPSVARDLARVLGAGTRRGGFLEGNGYRVTWALGHLVQFAEPDDYGGDWAGRWSMAQLPMLPETWRLKLVSRAAEQFKIVKGLLSAPDTESVVCATDAGREGELIFRFICEHARCRRPVQRLWVSSLTDEAIRAGLARLRPASDYDALAAAARARAQADWLVGMNLTRAYTVHNRVLCTIGRVQTPTLAMLCARDAAIAAFTKTLFYELSAHLTSAAGAPFDATWTRDDETRIPSRPEAERLRQSLAPFATGIITDLERTERRQRPPPLHDLTSLQRDANRRFGLTAARTLELAQELYERHKLISYPRTESHHIGEDLLPQLPGILQALDHPQAPVALARLNGGHRLGRAWVDQTKLTDHHAILPTARTPPPDLGGPLRQVYDLVATRFVAVFLPEARFEDTRVVVAIGPETFVAKASRLLEPGWRITEPARADAGETRALPPLAKGETVGVAALEVCERETEPPRPYDDATLLTAMRNAGRAIEDEALAAAMRGSGLGTPATRAEIIERLIRSGYCERQRKQLRSTAKGRALIDLVAEPLRSPELTAGWEQRLKDIEDGQASAADFYRDICALIGALIPQVASGPRLAPEALAAARSAAPGQAPGRRTGKGRRGQSAPPDAGLGPCPICTEGRVTENAKAFGCSRFREGCGLTIWKTIAGHTLTPEQVQALLTERRVGPIDGFQSKAGRAFSASLRLDGGGRVGFDFDDRSDAATDPAPATGLPNPTLAAAPIRCPRCGEGLLIEGHRGYGCNRYRAGCTFVVWKEIAGHRLSEAELGTLVATGWLGPLPGLDDDQGPIAKGWLHLDPAGTVTVRRRGPPRGRGPGTPQRRSATKRKGAASSRSG